MFCDGNFELAPLKFPVDFRDQDKGLEWFEKAAHLGNELSMTTLITEYIGRAKDDKEAEARIEYWGDKLVKWLFNLLQCTWRNHTFKMNSSLFSGC